MRSEQVETNLRCNQRCTYCTARREVDPPSWIRRAAVEARIGGAISAGARELVLSGGEPTLRRDLAELVARARREGAERVTLETNATVIDGDRARELASAGLDRAIVNLAGAGAWLDETTRDPGGFEATCRGIDALSDAGIAVDVQAAVVRSTAERLPDLPAFLRERFDRRVRTLFLVIPVRSPEPDELLGYDEAGRVIRDVEASARRAAIPLKLAPGSGPPPCVHGREPRVAHLYALTGRASRTDHVHLPVCAECVVRERCAGISTELLDRFGAPSMTPVTTDRARRRLSIIATVEEQIAREVVTESRHRDPVHGDVLEEIIRVVFQCNQACRFCFVSTHLPAAPGERIERAIREAASRGSKITLSGGEPTLHPELVSYVRLAKSLSQRPVILQTNAIRIADPALARALADAGLDEAFVSLHGATASVSDAVTHAPGTFEKTLRGIDQLVAVGVAVQINFVLCQSNFHELPAWVELLAERWPRAFANVSFVAPSTDVVPREHALVPRYGDVLPVLGEAVALAEARGLALGGFESMCGVPLCLVPSSLTRWLALSEILEDEDAGELVKTETCTGCALASRCHGVRRGYVELHGDSELRAVPSSAR